MILALLVACGTEGDPVIEAHRGGAGYWPANSRTAIQGSVDMGYEAVEFDLFLTSDRVPILAHDPFLDPVTCTYADGSELTEEVWISQLSAGELQLGYLCGGEPAPDTPDAQVVAETLATFDEIIDIVAEAPDMTVHLDVKWYPNVSHAPEVYAAEILERWWAAGLDNPWYASANKAEMIAALEDRDPDRDVVTSLSWPYFSPQGNDTLTGLGHALGATLGTEEGIAAATDAGADGLAIPWQLAERRQVEAAKNAGLAVQIWTVNDDGLQDALRRWPVDAIITDFPDPAP